MAVYWQGANGQIYLKGNDGKVQDMGRAWANDSKYLKAVGADTTKGSFEATRISDPNPPKPKQQDNSYLQGLQSQLSALQQQLAYQPKLAKFDVMGNFNRARSSAEQAVNPLYEKYLRDFLAKQQIQKENKGGEVNLRKQSNAMELAQSLAESGVNRGRTVEDTAAAIDKLNEQEGQMQQDTGTQFDVDRRALAEDIAARGMTSTGIAGGQMFDQQNMRNISEERQVKEFTNQREAKKLFSMRTLEDLARGDENAKQISSQKDTEAQFDLDAYLRELAADETQFRTENEVKRLGDINSQAQTFERQGTQQFLASLAGAGWRPQDIALAYQVYG
jgi:hypothetical protein